MLKSISVKNFKSFNSQQVLELERLTLLTGLNGSGKSSFYQVLSLLTQSQESTSRLSDDSTEIPVLNVNGSLLKIGTKEELFYNIQNNEVEFCLSWQDDTKNQLSFSLEQPIKTSSHRELFLKKHRFSKKIGDTEKYYEVSRDGHRWSITCKNILEFENFTFQRILDKHIRQKVKIETQDRVFHDEVIFDDIRDLHFLKFDLFSFGINFEQIKNCIDPKFIHLLDLAALEEECKKNDVPINQIRLNVSEKITRAYYLSDTYISHMMPFRGYPQRVYSEGIHTNPLQSLVSSADKRVPFRYNFKTKRPTTGTVKEALKYWVCDFFKFSDDIEVRTLVPDYSTEVLLKFGNKTVPINNTGFGISQILPVIYEILSTENKFLFVVDEPEIHLHPSAQTKLAWFFFEMSLVGKRILLETHSENLLNGLIYHLIKNENQANSTKMYWVKRTQDGSIIEKIVFDDLGYIVNQPESFMDEHSKLVQDLTEIRLKKMSNPDEL